MVPATDESRQVTPRLNQRRSQANAIHHVDWYNALELSLFGMIESLE
jgi:hypothetical protein